MDALEIASVADEAISATRAQAQRFRDDAYNVRERADATAKGLGALATTGLSAVGIAKFSDVFPVPSGQWPWVVATGIAFVVMAGVLAAFTFRLWNANRPLVAWADLADMKKDEIDGRERKAMQRVYERAAKRYGVSDMQALERRGVQFQDMADRETDPELAARLSATAARIGAALDAELARAQLVATRVRTNRALTGGPAVAYAVAFVLALVAFGIATDRLDSERSAARIATQRACKAAIVDAKIPVQALPKICEDVAK